MNQEEKRKILEVIVDLQTLRDYPDVTNMNKADRNLFKRLMNTRIEELKELVK